MSITKFKLLPVALLLTLSTTVAYAEKTVAPASNMENDEAQNKMRDGNPSVDSLLTVISAYETSLKQTREEAAANKRLAQKMTNWLIALTVAYVFVYIMGRRRLMRKIWAKNKDLRTALRRAEESDRMKSTFIQSMTHEIRTPLNAVSGFAEVICSPDYELSDVEKRDMQMRISSNVEQIASIINELLELSQSESEDVIPDSEKTDVGVNDLARTIVKERKGKQQTGVELRFTTNVSDDFKIRSNTYRLKTAVAHLVDNAIKFTEKGSVVLRCELQDNHVRYIVTDTGCGIKEEDRERIFEIFHKGDDFKVGVGLGLSISRRMLQSLGGDVWLDTTYTNGARFIISLPCGG